MSKIRALKGFVYVKLDESLEFLGRIALPAHAKEDVETGTVISAGPGAYDDKGKFKENPVKDNDRVIIAKGSGIKMEIEGEELLVLTPDEITGIIREE